MKQAIKAKVRIAHIHTSNGQDYAVLQVRDSNNATVGLEFKFSFEELGRLIAGSAGIVLDGEAHNIGHFSTSWKMVTKKVRLKKKPKWEEFHDKLVSLGKKRETDGLTFLAQHIQETDLNKDEDGWYCVLKFMKCVPAKRSSDEQIMAKVEEGFKDAVRKNKSKKQQERETKERRAKAPKTTKKLGNILDSMI